MARARPRRYGDLVLDTTSVPAMAPAGQLLREWRVRRRMSQLDLASTAGISARHLSFVETGRSRPSREMLLHLAENLEVPLRERNPLLIAAGFAPTYQATDFEAPEMPPRIENIAQWSVHIFDNLRRQIAVTGDDELRELERELIGYLEGMGVSVPPVDEAPRAIATPMRLRTDSGELALMTMIATFGTALDITLAELSLETFLPADAATAAALFARMNAATS
jgi:transcriptional regulator with XRE-family HTH domain